jgi:hypothetical protein
MIIREVVTPGSYVYKVFGSDGALMYYGSSEEVAEIMEKELKSEKAAPSNDGEQQV